MADQIMNAIESFIYGFLIKEINFSINESDYVTAAKEYDHLLPKSEYPALYGLSSLLRKGHYTGACDIEFGLDVLISAFAQL